jgi:hypothetical protein
MRETLILRNIKRDVCHKYTNCRTPALTQALTVTYFTDINSILIYHPNISETWIKTTQKNLCELREMKISNSASQPLQNDET